ncbi:hypothetical protein [Ramlibacter sp. PS4R-6]|uniref:hypothetical protein n=1 Tax=Ramlibacter sp. PS4R-6 TaxID=3133438 RepID=UPI00309FECA6
MGIARRVFASVILLAAGIVQAQQQEAASPYSLGLAVSRAPIGLKDLSVVGRAQVASFTAFGKLGTTTASRPDAPLTGLSTLAVPLQETAPGMSWGGGVSWDFSPRLTATFEWISYDLRMSTGLVRSTNLGLQYKY